MENEKEEIYQKLIEMAKKIESFGLGCIVTDNPFRAAEEGEGAWHCFIITQPINGRELAEKEFMDLFRKAQGLCREIIKTDHLPIDFGPVLLIDSLERWLNFLDGYGKHPILHGFPCGSTDVFLSKVIYGKEAHEKIIRAFQNKYGKKFIQECYEVWMGELKRRREVLDVSNKELFEEVEERKKPFNKFELEEIRDFLLSCLKFCKENEISAIVGIDCSGRPLAQMLHSILKEIGYNPILEFLDPHRLKESATYEGIDKLKVPDIFVEEFKKEFPAIFKLLKEDPEKVFFIDDQIYSYFKTSAAIKQLIGQAIEKEDFKFSFWVVSGFNGYNGLTWWKDKSFLRIKSNKKCKGITLRSFSRKTSAIQEIKIKNFEAKLSEIAAEVLNIWRIQTENSLVVR